MCRIVSTLAVLGVLAGSPAVAQPPNVVAQESVTTATVDRIEKSTRVVTLRGTQNEHIAVYVDPSIAAFDTLKVGDVVTVRYTESAIVKVRPNASLSEARDTTEAAQAAGKGNVIGQQTAVVKIESIDPQAQAVTYRTASGLKAVRVVNDKRLLQGLRAGDTVEVTLTRERALSIERQR